MDESKRKFLKDYFIRDTLNLARKTLDAFKEGEEKEGYFDSFESAYPLISETTLFMDDEVKELGIDTTGKDKLEIVKEIYSKRNKR